MLQCDYLQAGGWSHTHNMDKERDIGKEKRVREKEIEREKFGFKKWKKNWITITHRHTQSFACS